MFANPDITHFRVLSELPVIHSQRLLADPAITLTLQSRGQSSIAAAMSFLTH
jgi:hypothetical protein